MGGLKGLWVAVDGSIFTQDEFKIKVHTGELLVRQAIAFNVGKEIAEHIVELHNAEIFGPVLNLMQQRLITVKAGLEILGVEDLLPEIHKLEKL